MSQKRSFCYLLRDVGWSRQKAEDGYRGSRDEHGIRSPHWEVVWGCRVETSDAWKKDAKYFLLDISTAAITRCNATSFAPSLSGRILVDVNRSKTVS
jgi:hypothetical protein